jgi:hypothetical protein
MLDRIAQAAFRQEKMGWIIGNLEVQTARVTP